MKVRKFLFWCHLTVGSIAGLVIFTMCATGVLLAFERQIIAYAERAFCVSAPVEVAVNRNQSLLLNPYSSQVLGEGAKRTHSRPITLDKLSH